MRLLPTRLSPVRWLSTGLERLPTGLKRLPTVQRLPTGLKRLPTVQRLPTGLKRLPTGVSRRRAVRLAARSRCLPVERRLPTPLRTVERLTARLRAVWRLSGLPTVQRLRAVWRLGRLPTVRRLATVLRPSALRGLAAWPIPTRRLTALQHPAGVLRRNPSGLLAGRWRGWSRTRGARSAAVRQPTRRWGRETARWGRLLR
ncbi:hypothetical protein [Amycolatopsis sp. NPDC003861]